MYSVMSFGHMASDGVRMDAYARAIAQAVQPDSVVVDIGAGTGILSLLAARAGARKVHAVDINPAVLLLRDLAEENGLADRIEVHLVSAFELTLPEKADVIVSDLRGSGPLNGEHLAVIRDARERLLRPDGVLIPAQDRLMVAVVESTDLSKDLDRALVGFRRRGLSASATLSSMVNSLYIGAAITASDMLSRDACWATIDYAQLPSGVVEGTTELEIHRGGHANALAVWFEATIFDGLGYSTAPGTASVYSRALLPLTETIEVRAGDRLTVTVRADERGDRWAWDTAVMASDGSPKRQLRQATFLGMPTSAEPLLRLSASFKPTRSARGERAARTLGAMDGEHSVAEIADLVSGETRLPRQIVLDEVRDLVGRFAR